MKEFKIGWAAGPGGTGVSFLLLTIIYVMVKFYDPEGRIILVLLILFLLWAGIQFSYLTVQYDPSKNRIRKCVRFLWFIQTGKYINVSEIEAFYTRKIKLKGTLKSGNVMGVIGGWNKTVVRDEEYCLEIKYPGHYKYEIWMVKPIAILYPIAKEVFFDAGIPYKKILPPTTRKKRR